MTSSSNIQTIAGQSCTADIEDRIHVKEHGDQLPNCERQGNIGILTACDAHTIAAGYQQDLPDGIVIGGRTVATGIDRGAGNAGYLIRCVYLIRRLHLEFTLACLAESWIPGASMTAGAGLSSALNERWSCSRDRLARLDASVMPPARAITPKMWATWTGALVSSAADKKLATT